LNGEIDLIEPVERMNVRLGAFRKRQKNGDRKFQERYVDIRADYSLNQEKEKCFMLKYFWTG